MRVRILQRTGRGGYRGMDRPPIGSFPDVDEALAARGIALEANPDARDLRTFMAELGERGINSYEAVALGDAGDDWDLLGYDVGETTPAAWSAIAHRDDFLGHDQRAGWLNRLNEHGLFTGSDDAAAFLEVYLSADDPDRGWDESGWTDDPGWYAVVPVSCLR